MQCASATSDAIPGRSDRLLSERLRELEAAGVVRRAVYRDVPRRAAAGVRRSAGAGSGAPTASRMTEATSSADSPSWLTSWLGPPPTSSTLVDESRPNRAERR